MYSEMLGVRCRAPLRDTDIYNNFFPTRSICHGTGVSRGVAAPQRSLVVSHGPLPQQGVHDYRRLRPSHEVVGSYWSKQTGARCISSASPYRRTCGECATFPLSSVHDLPGMRPLRPLFPLTLQGHQVLVKDGDALPALHEISSSMMSERLNSRRMETSTKNGKRPSA